MVGASANPYYSGAREPFLLNDTAFYRAMHFSANARSCDRMSSVCLSVCPSVTLVICDHIGWKSWKLTARTISPTPSLFVARRRSTYIFLPLLTNSFLPYFCYLMFPVYCMFCFATIVFNTRVNVYFQGNRKCSFLPGCACLYLY